MDGHVAQVQCLKVLSIDAPVKTPYPAPTDGDSSLIDASDGNRRTVNHIHPPAQVVPGNGYAGFNEQQSHLTQTFAGQHTAPVQSHVPPGFVVASQLPQQPPSRQQIVQAASQQPSNAAALLPIDFGDVPAPVVISGSLDNTLKMWDVNTATCSRTLFGHIEGVWGVDMDKLRIVSASHDRTIKIWDRVSGRCLHTLVGHRGAVTSVALGDDKIISGSDDSSIRIWSFAQ